MSITYRPTLYLYTPTQPVVLFVYKWKYFEHVEGTNSKSEVIQTNITANMEIKEQKLGQHANKINNKMKPLQKNRVSRRIERRFYAEIVITKDVKTYNLRTWTTQTPLRVEQKNGGELKCSGTTNGKYLWSFVTQM